jgi:protein-S-isoprenylcysteine O-methyltransferase Ste14
MKLLEHRIPPPIVVVLTGGAMAAVARALPSPTLELPLRAAVGAAVVAAGFAIVARAFFTFRNAGTTIDPVQVERASALVTQGIFGHSRNPMYVGMAVMLFGWAAFLGSAWLALGPVAFVLFTTRFQIVPEERAMRGRFGEAYAAYTRRVRRWV